MIHVFLCFPARLYHKADTFSTKKLSNLICRIASCIISLSHYTYLSILTVPGCINYLNFCFWFLEWECHFLIEWPVFKLLHMVYSKYPFFVCPPLVLGLQLLSHKLHSVVGSPGFHQQCTIRPNVTIRAMGIMHFLLASYQVPPPKNGKGGGGAWVRGYFLQGSR